MNDQPIQNDVEMLDDPEAGSTWFISLVSVVLLIVTVLALVVMFFDFAEAEVDRKVVDKPTIELQELKLGQQEILTEYGTYEIEDADGSKLKRIRIPVKRAMELVLADERSRTAVDSDEAVAAR